MLLPLSIRLIQFIFFLFSFSHFHERTLNTQEWDEEGKKKSARFADWHMHTGVIYFLSFFLALRVLLQRYKMIIVVFF